MAFPTGWGKKHKLIIDHTKVSGSANLTNFPVYLSGDNFLPDVFTKAAARREINANWLLNDANLQGYWRLESDGGDSGPNGYNLTNSGASFVTGKFGNGADFEEGDSDLMYINNPANLNFSGSFTISAWINVKSASLTGAVLSKWQGNSQYIFGTSAGKPHIIVKNSSNVNYDITGNTTLSLSTWYHIVGVWDTTNNKLKIYLNGLPDNVDTTTSGTPMSDTSYVVMGAQETTGTLRKFDGIIDDVAIFNRALSDYEVKALYYGTADLRFSSDISGSTELASEVVFFDPDNSLAEVYVKVPTVSYNTNTDFYVWYEASSEAPYAPTATYGSQAVWSDYEGVWHLQSSFEDSSPNGYHLTAVNSPTNTTGKISSAKAFLRTSSQYATNTSVPNLNVMGDKTMTFWIKSTAFYANKMTPVGLYTYGEGGFWTEIDASGNLLSRSDGWASGDVATSSAKMSTGIWYHGAARISGTNHAVFLNGAKNEVALSGTEATLSGEPISIGRNGSYGDQDMDGSVDEVRFRASALSDDWIATEYANQNSPGTFVSATEATDNAIFFGTNF